MYSSFSEPFSVIADTLMIGRAGTADKIPEQTEDGHAIRKIGAGAFMETKNKQICIPAHINRIGDKAFLKVSGVQSIYFADPHVSIGQEAFAGISPGNYTVRVRYDQAEAKKILSLLRRAGQSRYIGDRQSLPANTLRLIEAVFSMSLTAIPSEVGQIFRYCDSTKQGEGPDLFKETPCLDFRGGTSSCSEDRAFRRLMREGMWPLPRIEDDLADDWQLKNEIRAASPGTNHLVGVEVDVHQPEPDKTVLRFHKIEDMFFWQSARKVYYRQKQYYIYQRNYIGPKDRGGLGSHREDIAVYAEDGLVTDYALSEAVYAKYLFTALL